MLCFGCMLCMFVCFCMVLDDILLVEYGIVLLGSGDFYYLSWLLIEWVWYVVLF